MLVGEWRVVVRSHPRFGGRLQLVRERAGVLRRELLARLVDPVRPLFQRIVFVQDGPNPFHDLIGRTWNKERRESGVVSLELCGGGKRSAALSPLRKGQKRLLLHGDVTE